MATEPVLKFGSPEWRAKFMKAKHLPVKSVSIVPAALAAKSVSIVPTGSATPKFGTPEWREKYQSGRSSVSSASKSLSKSLGLGKLETWQVVLLAAGGALVLQHLIAPKGTSIVSKVLGGVGGAGGGFHVGEHYVGAVTRGGFRNNSGMPFGPGPWPTQNAAAPDGNMQTPDPARNDPSMMTGWGYGWE